MKSRSEEDAFLLAYYFGNLHILNCAALQSITTDLVDNFLTSPKNNTTKYSGHVEGCCICHEKEVLFKRVLRQYYQVSNGSYSTSEETHPDIDECWKEVEKMWNDHGIVRNWDEEPVNCVAGNYQADCLQLLSKHKVLLHKATTPFCEKRWKNLLTSIKKGLEKCIDSIAKINKGKLDVTPLASQCRNFSKKYQCPNFSKKFRNAYLTLMISRSARAQAKFLQGCREVGIQIRAAREPIAVVCRYMICEKCMEKPKLRKISNVTNILKYSVTDFAMEIPYNKLPDPTKKLRSEKKKHAAHAKRLRSVEVTFCSPKRVPSNSAVNGGAISKCEPIYILKSSPTTVFSPVVTNPIKRKLAIPATEAKKFRLPSGSYDKESVNVVIVGDNNQRAAPLTGTGPSGFNTPKISGSSKPINIKSLKVINTQIKSPNGATKILSTHGRFPIQNRLALSNSMQLSDNVSMTKISQHSIFQPSLTPINVMDMKKIPRRPSVENTSKTPFVVRIIDNKLTNSPPLVKKFKPNQSVPVIKTIPLSNSGIKFVKAVSLSSQASRTHTGAIFVRGLKLPNSAVAPPSATTVFRRNGLHTMQPVKVISSSFKPDISKGVLYSNGKFNTIHRPVKKFLPSGQPYTFVNMDVPGAQTQNDGHRKLGSSQLKMANRTPSKKRNKTSFPSKPVSTVVAEYLLSLTPSADKDLLRKLKRRTKRRSEKSSSLIPTPYETHFLCIDNTIKKLGWKAYWYRKCRCSKVREKSAGTDKHDDYSKVHSLEDMKDWIPAVVTDQMRAELSKAFEREDNYISPTTNGCSTSKEPAVGTNNASTPNKIINDKAQLDSSRVKLEFDPPLPQLSSSKPAETSQTVAEETNAKSYSSINQSTNKKLVPVTLKAKYCRGKNGLWKPMNEAAHCSFKGQPNAAAMTSHSHTGNSVKLNLGCAFVDEAKDSVRSLSVDGVRRCPRATMLRRKSLIERAQRFERNTKAKRQRTESYVSENFLFSSTCNPSACDEQGFSVISPHPVVFRECENLQSLFQVIRDGKSSLKLNVCKRQLNDTCEQQQQKKYYENIISSIMQNVTANVSAVESKPIQKKSQQPKMNQKCQLLNDLEVAWDKSNARNSSNSVVTQSLGSDKRRPMKKTNRKCIMHIKPELMYNCLQVLRRVPSSEPLTNVISEESAEFVASALKTSDSSSKSKPSNIVPKEEVINHCSRMDAKYSNGEEQKSVTLDRAVVSTTTVSLLPKPCNDKVKSDMPLGAPAITKTPAQSIETTKRFAKRKRVNDDSITVPSIGAVFYRLNYPLPDRSSPRQCKESTDELLSVTSFQGKLSRYFKSCHTLSCLLGSGSVLRLEEDLMDGEDHYIDDPKLESPDKKRPTMQVNKRKRPTSLLNGVHGLEDAAADVSQHQVQDGGCNELGLSYKRPMTSLLSKDLNVSSLKNCLWETTSARPVGLYRKYYTKRAHIGTPKKDFSARPSVDNASKVEDQQLSSPPPAVAFNANEPEFTSATHLRQSLMLIKPSPHKTPPHKRPQGISHARMPRVPHTAGHEREELNGNADEKSNGFSPPREVDGDELMRILQPRPVRSSERLKKGDGVASPKDCTNVQMLRETVFAELQSRKRRRYEKEDINEGESTNSDRKANRYSTNGNFISRLLQFDSENFVDDNS